jgi:hypothetical protein
MDVVVALIGIAAFASAVEDFARRRSGEPLAEGA